MSEETPTFPYTWKNRRRYLWAVTAFCMATVVYCLALDLQSAVAETAVSFSFIAILAMTGSYVFGAVWQDISHMKTNRK